MSRFRINMFELVMSLSGALDLLCPKMANHHSRVAYTALRLAEKTDAVGEAAEDIVVAAALHDIGVLSSAQRIESSMDASHHHSARFGYEVLRKFEPFARAARIIRYHHVPWEHGEGGFFGDDVVPRGSHVLHLANRLDAEIRQDEPIFDQVERLCRFAEGYRGSLFVPEQVDAFLELAQTEAFWLDLFSPHQEQLLAAHTAFSEFELDLDGLLRFAEMWAQVIDFRSRYTATHSSGVAATAEAIAQLMGWPDSVSKKVRVAGYLHDIGKLAIPVEVIEKRGAFTAAERRLIKTHSYYSRRILGPIADLEDITTWCALHHERLDGTGYPYRVRAEAIPPEARVIAAADVFTAVAEDRPYRAGLDKAGVIGVLEQAVDEGHLDGAVVGLLCEHYEWVDACRERAQRVAVASYEQFMGNLKRLDLSWAKQSHLDWKERLEAHISGRETIASEELLSHRSCALGQWYYSEGLFRYRHIPEIRQLERPHQKLHEGVREIVALSDAGRLEEAEMRLFEVELLSIEIVRLLETIEQSAWLPAEALVGIAAEAGQEQRAAG